MRLSNSNRERSGYALLLTLIFTGVLLILFSSMMYWTATNAKLAKRNNLFVQSQAAAESADELVLAHMINDYASGDLQAASDYTSIIPSQTNWPMQFLFSDTNGVANQVSVDIENAVWDSLPAQYAGLWATGQVCVVKARATPLNTGEDMAAEVDQTILFTKIPIFQFAIFYNMDLEINPGADMDVGGKVHSNQNIWATGASSSQQLTFHDIVEAAQKYNNISSPKDPHNHRSGNVKFLQTANNPQSNVNSLNLPIGGTNRDPAVLRSILGIPPSPYTAPSSGAYSSDGQMYPYNQADLIIFDAASGTNITIYYQNPNRAPVLDPVPFDVTNKIPIYNNKGTKIIGTNYLPGFSFVTNVTFYDYREYCNVKALQIDVAAFNAWLTNAVTGGKKYDDYNWANPFYSKNHHINSIYVYNAIPFIVGSHSSDGQLPAVRMVNGQQLFTNGLTVATPQPIYVEGNYNVTRDGVHYALTLGSTTNTYVSGGITNHCTRPAAFLADAITILSTNWNDSLNIKGKALGQRQPDDTTINAACFEGIVQSDGVNYSGGVENFLRLLEDWGSKKHGASGQATLVYNGSIVVMFPSQYGLQPWQTTGVYYNPPNRKWGFDTTFYSQDGIPPMTPQVKAVIRQSWMDQ